MRKDSTSGRKNPGEGTVKGQAVLVAVWLLTLGALSSVLLGQEATPAAEAEKPKELRVRDLSSMVYQLNYVGADRALAIIKVMGYRVIDPGSFDASKPVDSADLPYVCRMPDPEKSSLTESGRRGSAFGISLPGLSAQEFNTSTTGGPLEQLLIIYEPNVPRDGVSRLLELLNSQIDVPARQMLIEGMVLEVSEIGIKELGVQYDVGRYDATGVDARASGTFQTALGETVRPLILTFDSSIRGALDRYRVVLRALIRSGEAQVLSRPSILALDNRQARIRVTTEVPVSSTAITELTTELKVAYISVGIVLNIRPRMSSNGEDVSFQIEASVSDIDPTSPFRIELDPESLLNAQAPVVLTREVKTYARVRNNTPLIIGGLISKRSSKETDRIPFLSDIPILGWLFKSKANSTERREVIIVLTPYVLPEKTAVSRAMPKDSEYFDEIDPILFRAMYRIRIQDVFDLSFLWNNPELTELTNQTKALVQTHPELAKQPLFKGIVAGEVPGETILVERMVYQIVKKLEMMNKITPSNLVMFKQNTAEPAGFEVQFLTEELTGDRNGNLEEYFQKNPNKALAVIFNVPESARAQDVIRQSIPQIQEVELTSRDEWGRKLYELNQPVNGVDHWAILINDAKDMERLQAALVLKRTIGLNTTDDGFQLKHFKVGRQLTFPVVEPKRTYLIDWEVAKYFYHTEHYYAAFQEELAKGLAELRAEISRQQSTMPEE